MRTPWLLLLACAGCVVDTSHLTEPVDVSPWLHGETGEQLVDPGVFAPTRAPIGVARGSGEPGAQGAPSVVESTQHAIDLAAVLQLAGSNSIDVALARSQAMEAAHVAEEQKAMALPFLTPRLGFFRHENRAQSSRGVLFDVDRQNASAGAGVDIVLQPSEAIYRSLAASRRANAAAATYRANVDATLVRAARTYFRLASSFASQGIADDDLRAAQELLRIESVRKEAGAGLAASVARARSLVAEAEGRVQAAIGAVAAYSADLVALLNLPSSTQLLPRVADAVVLIDLIDASQPTESLLELAYQQNPELRAAKNLTAAAGSDADLTRWGWLLPELRAGAMFDEFGSRFNALQDREEYYVGVQWRLDFGMAARHSANVERQHQAALQVVGGPNRVAAAIVRLCSQIKAAAARVEAGAREVEAATETLALVQARQREGVDLLLHVLDAQAALSRARSRLVVAVSDHNIAQYSLLRAVGGAR